MKPSIPELTIHSVDFVKNLDIKTLDYVSIAFKSRTVTAIDLFTGSLSPLPRLMGL